MGIEDQKEKKICIRPHHGLCLQFFEGKGYSEDFAVHMGHIKDALEKGKKIRITAGADDICAKCPNRRGNGCVSDEKVEEYDSRVLKACGLKYGETLSWEELARRVGKKIISGVGREKICPDCQWSSICKKKE